MIFQKESVARCRDEITPLLKAHYAEIARYQDIPFDPNWDLYVKLDEIGCLQVYTVRDDAGRLVGYSVYAVQPDIHYRTSVQATQDILFLDPAYRGRMVGVRFLRWCDEQLRAQGVQVVYCHVDSSYDFSPILKRIGYEHIDTTYGRRLDKD